MHMGGFVLYEERQPKKVLFLSDMECLLKEGRIKLPTITEEDIQDRSKGDGLSKAIVIGQTSWFVTQVIARHVQGLDITQVELLTAALAALNGMMYFLWWNKPLDVRCSIPIHYLDVPKPIHERYVFTSPFAGIFLNFLVISFFEDFIGNAETQTPYQKLRHCLTSVATSFEGAWRSGKLSMDMTRIRHAVMMTTSLPWVVLQAFFWRLRKIIDGFNSELQDVSVPSFWTSDQTIVEFGLRASYASLVIAIPFGVIHCAGWFFIFPSPAELILWRVCSAILVGAPALMLYVTGVIHFLVTEDVMRGSDIPLGIEVAGFIVFLVYIIARLLILGETFCSLRNLPPGAYELVEWTTFIPHI